MAEQEKKEVVQDLIDRLLYLSEADKLKFMVGLNNLFTKYDTNVQIINGIRVCKINKV
jgi:hypothetical protein